MEREKLNQIIDNIKMMRGPYFKDLELAPDDIVTGIEELEQFAAAIRKAAFDECAEICREVEDTLDYGTDARAIAGACADEITERSKAECLTEAK